MSEQMKHNAPAVGQDCEGNDQTPDQQEEGTTMTEITDHAASAEDARRERAKFALPNTAAADPDIVISDAPASDFYQVLPQRLDAPVIADARLRSTVERMRSLPVRFSQSATLQTKVWRTINGRWWRRGGIVRLQVMPDGVRAFHVIVYRGANEADVKFLLGMIAKARDGVGLQEMWQPIVADWADDETWKCTMSRSYEDPYRLFDDDAKAVVCTEPLCIEGWHRDCDKHEMETVTRDVGGGGYDIRALLDLDAGSDEGWRVEVQADDLLGTTADIESLVSDLQWVTEACRRANAARRAAGAVAA